MQQYVIFNALKVYCIPKEEAEADVLFIVLCPFVLLAIVLYVIRFTSDYHFDILKPRS
jgi:hypothetical protein